MALNHDQLDALSTALMLARAGVAFTAEDTAKRVVCDGLVKTGHPAPIAGVPNGYTVGEEIAKAMIVRHREEGTCPGAGQLMAPRTTEPTHRHPLESGPGFRRNPGSLASSPWHSGHSSQISGFTNHSHHGRDRWGEGLKS